MEGEEASLTPLRSAWEHTQPVRVPKGSSDLSPWPGREMAPVLEQPVFIAQVLGVHPRAGGEGVPIPPASLSLSLLFDLLLFWRRARVAGVTRGWQGSGGPAVGRPLLVSGTMTRRRLFAG